MHAAGAPRLTLPPKFLTPGQAAAEQVEFVLPARLAQGRSSFSHKQRSLVDQMFDTAAPRRAAR